MITVALPIPENKTPAHSNITNVVGVADKSEDKHKYATGGPSARNCSSQNKLSGSGDAASKMHVSNQNSDILASYQAYLYSAMLYSDYMSMQQYSLLNSNGTSNSNSNSNSNNSNNIKTNNVMPDIFNNFKHPQPNKPSELVATSNNNPQQQSTIVTPTAASVPLELALSSSSSSSCSSLSNSSRMHKRTKVTSFSVESMGITAAAAVACSSSVAASSAAAAQSPAEPKATSCHVPLPADASDDYAVLDLSSR